MPLPGSPGGSRAESPAGMASEGCVEACEWVAAVGFHPLHVCGLLGVWFGVEAGGGAAGTTRAHFCH